MKYYTKNTPDNELWQGLREDEETAFTELTSRYYRKLIHYGQKFTPNAQLIEDALQDLMINLWLHRKSISDTPSVKYYLMKSFRNQLFKSIKTNNKSAEWQDHFDEIQTELSSEEVFVLQENETGFKNEVSRMLGMLPTRQKEVMYLRFYQELTPEEIANLLSIRPQSVSNIIQRALSNLRENWMFISLLILLFYQIG